MSTRKLTAAAVERLKAPAAGRSEHFDATMPGFGLRITATGHKSWVYLYRHGGKVRRMTLGGYPKIGLKDARDLARKAANRAAEGYDPATERQERQKATAGTFETTAEKFIELYAKRHQRSWRTTKQYFDRDLIPCWGKRPIDSITRGDVLQLLDETMAEGKEAKANNLHGHLNKFFNWAIERGFVESSPMPHVSRPAKNVKRDRVLNDGEVVALWNACDLMGYPFGPFIRVLILTAQRRTEAGTMRWADLNFDAAVWHLPRDATKSDRAHEVPLSPLAIEILKALPKSGEYVFSSGRRGDRPISGYGPAKERLDKLSDVTDWRFHDLRRTAASNLAKLNTPPHVLAKILNHMSDGTGVTAIYNRYAYEPEKRHALEAWAQRLASIIQPADDEKIVPLRPGAG